MATTQAPLASPAPATPDTDAPVAPTAIHIPALAWVAVVVVLLYIAWAFAGTNIAPDPWNHLHEFFHDGRHFLGIPCH